MWSSSLFTSCWSRRYSGPIFARVLIHSGLRSIGVWALRTSRRSIRGPLGWGAHARDRRPGLGEEPLRDGVDELLGRHRSAEFTRDGGDPRIADAARDDPVVWVERVAAVEREPVHGDAVGDADADRGDLVLEARWTDPDARAAIDATALDPEVGEDVDEDALEPAHVAHHVDGFGQSEDRIPHELAGTVPGDLAAAVDVDDGGPVGRPFVGRGALAGGVDGGVFQEDDGVGAFARDDRAMDGALKVETLDVRHGVGA